MLSTALKMSANLENSAVAMGLEKISFHSSPNERKCQRMTSYHTIALISRASKVVLKVLQAGLPQHMNRELPDVQADLEKTEDPEIKSPTFVGP